MWSWWRDMEVKKLKECCTIIAGQSPESKYYNSNGDGLPFFQGKADFGELYPSIRVYCSQPTKIAEKDDILLSVRAPVGPTNLAPCKVCIGRGLTAIRPSEVLLTRYVLLFFRYFEAQLASKGTGTTFKAITQDVVKNLEIPIPPLPEQERIVSRIEELFSQLDAGVETLKKTKAQLSVYRQAVLKEAFENISTFVPLSDVCQRVFDGPFGSNLKTSDYVPSGVRVVRLENLKNMWFDDSKQSFITNEKYELIASHTVFPTDLIMSTFISDSIKVCRLPNYIEYAVNKADCVGIRLSDNINPDFVMFWLSSKEAYNRLSHQIHGATRPRVNTKQIKAIQIPSAKKEVQDKIVSVIQAKFSVCDNIEQTINIALQQAEAMRQSILKDAFEGRL